MFEYLYQWIENMTFGLVIFTIVIQLVPNNSYKKYIHFFMGLILIIMLSNPIMKLFGMEESFHEFYKETEYEQKVKEIEEATKYLEDISSEIQ